MISKEMGEEGGLSVLLRQNPNRAHVWCGLAGGVDPARRDYSDLGTHSLYLS